MYSSALSQPFSHLPSTCRIPFRSPILFLQAPTSHRPIDVQFHFLFFFDPSLVLYIFLFILFFIAPIILCFPGPEYPKRNFDYEVHPEDIHRLQAREQGEGNVLRDPALVLLGVPIELEGADGSEGSGNGVEDDNIDVVAEVDPDGNEDAEVRGDDSKVEVGEGFGSLSGKATLGWVLDAGRTGTV